MSTVASNCLLLVAAAKELNINAYMSRQLLLHPSCCLEQGCLLPSWARRLRRDRGMLPMAKCRNRWMVDVGTGNCCSHNAVKMRTAINGNYWWHPSPVRRGSAAAVQRYIL